ncbi:MAG: hypothetical protein WCD35_11995 [Mycobacteriales bacterium]
MKVSPWLWLAIPLVLVLLRQAYVGRRNADEVLISAMHLGYVKIPILENLTNELASMGLARDEPTWMAASVIAAHRLGEFELANGFLTEAPPMIATGGDEDEDEEQLAIFEQFLQAHNPEYAELFRRRASGFYDLPVEERARLLDLK